MKKYLIAGLIILLPLLLTILLFIFIIDLFTAPFLNVFIEYLSRFQDNFSLLANQAAVDVIAKILIILVLCVLIFLLGFVARWFFFKSLISVTNKILSKIPFVKSIFNTLRDIVTSFIAVDKRQAFKYTIMVEFPAKETYLVGFVSGEIPKECKEKVKENLTPVFLPTAPHPISGYFVMVPDELIHKIDMSNEDAVKFTVSCGLILPGEKLPDAPKK